MKETQHPRTKMSGANTAKNKNEGTHDRQERKCTRRLLMQATGARLLKSSSKSVRYIQHLATSTSIPPRRRARRRYRSIVFTAQSSLFGDNFFGPLISPHRRDVWQGMTLSRRRYTPSTTCAPTHSKRVFGSTLEVLEALLQPDNLDTIRRYPNTS